jgi:hypothetical protein
MDVKYWEVFMEPYEIEKFLSNYQRNSQILDLLKEQYEENTAAYIPEMDTARPTVQVTRNTDGLLKSFVAGETIAEAISQCKEYRKKFHYAWQRMSIDERFILRQFYLQDYSARRATDIVMKQLSVSRRELHEKRQRALDKMEKLVAASLTK